SRRRHSHAGSAGPEGRDRPPTAPTGPESGQPSGARSLAGLADRPGRHRARKGQSIYLPRYSLARENSTTRRTTLAGDHLQLPLEGSVEDGGEQGVEFGLVVGLGMSDGGCLGLETLNPKLFVINRDGDFDLFQPLH